LQSVQDGDAIFTLQSLVSCSPAQWPQSDEKQ